MKESPKAFHREGEELRPQTQDPARRAVAVAMAKALCRLAHLDPRFSAAKPAGRIFATLILVTCCWSVAALFLLVDTTALAWAVMTLALCLNVFRLWTCCLPEPRVSACPQVNIKGAEPVWTILVALYQEAGSVGSLLNALDKLDWPKEKIDLVFACEGDDSETLAALNLRRDSYRFRIIAIPTGGPRTKPKALQTALPFCRGRYLTVYDAEDLPASGQLREAWRAFRNGPANLAVVQAPLVIWNERESWISRQFALDYAIWFRPILPGLVRLSHFLPLGGTSNHFDITHLRAVGGWDPFNVTEDADLGARFARLGLTANLIRSPTYEEGAPTFAGWVRQRGRWIQGHIQTVSVHLRTPGRLTLQLGGFGLLAFLLGLTTGPLNAAILFVSALLAIGQTLAGQSDQVLLWVLSMALSQAVVGMAAVLRDGRNSLWIACFALPLYQACQVPALFRAIWRIYLSPSIWDKTKHGAEARPRRFATAEGQHAMSEPQTWIGQQL
jgi:glycosyltransferase XagB